MTGSIEPLPSDEPVSTHGVCPVCRTPAIEDSIECPDCHVRHHQECWVYNNGCGKYGCASAPATEKLTDLEVPPAFWGQSEKECPACHKMIQAAALRCRHCGTVFATAKPQNLAEFHEQRTLTSDLPALRRNAMLLLVLGVIPCTAALTAIFGGIWYYTQRDRLARLPASQSALAKIGLGIAIGQTLLLLVVGLLHSLLST
jgi:rubredoxin